MIDSIESVRIANDLFAAWRDGQPIAQCGNDPALDLGEAYGVQARSLALRTVDGVMETGVKLAFTNRAAMARLGVHVPVCGRLLSDMRIADGARLQRSSRIRPRVEPELAFLMAGPLAPDASDAQLLVAIEAVAPALEIVDSRYRDFHFVLADVVADNASASAYVIGPWQPAEIDLGALAVTLEFNGSLIASGSTAAILDHPFAALRIAARLAAATGRPLDRGSIVMAGSATDAFALPASGTVRATIENLGAVRCVIE